MNNQHLTVYKYVYETVDFKFWLKRLSHKWWYCESEW